MQNYRDLYTYENIKKTLLNRITREIDKREGSLTADAISAISLEIDEIYKHLDYIRDMSFGDTAEREFLLRRCLERGIEPYYATASVVKGEFNVKIDPATRFNTVDGNQIFYIDEYIEEVGGLHYYKMKCVDAGTQGNIETAKLVPVRTIPYLTKASVVGLLVAGEDEEDTESLRTRYIDSFRAEAFCGNRADYVRRINQLTNVGAVKAYRATSLVPGEVTIKFLDSSYNVPSAETISAIQEAVDPVGLQGGGYGIAPINHKVLVGGATATTINISMSLEFETGFTYAALEAQIRAAVEEYLLSLRKTWQDTNGLTVRLSRIEIAILGIPGIKDISGLKLNNLATNVAVGADNVPVLGAISNV